MKRVHVLSLAGAVAAGAFGGLLVERAMADQPHMQNALSDLRAARAELVSAQANKGGYRAQAIGFVDQAISATNSGIAYAGG